MQKNKKLMIVMSFKLDFPSILAIDTIYLVYFATVQYIAKPAGFLFIFETALGISP